MTAPQRDSQHVLLRTVLVLSALGVVASAVLLVFGLPLILRNADNSSAVIRGNDLQACRATLNTEVTDAADRLDGANADVVATIAAIVTSSLRHDQAAAARLGPQLEARRAALLTAERAKTAAVANYRRSVEQSRTNASTFLAACRKDG